MSDRDPCPSCGSTDFYDEDGQTICEICGAVQEGGFQAADEDEFGAQRKKARLKEDKKKVKVSKVYRGTRARKLYLQTWQHILWKQCHTLIHGQCKLPGELWTVVRDLWTLRLTKLSQQLEEADTTLSSAREESETTPRDNTIGDDNNKVTNKLPTLWESIAMNYFGVLLLQYPTSLATIYDLIRSEQICFIRAIRHVPREMSNKLPPEHRLALDTTVIPQPEDLQNAVIRLVGFFENGFDMSIPKLNWSLSLHQYIMHLALPLEIFPAVKNLAEILDYDVGYAKSPGTRRTPTTCPDARLMALVVFATKLLFPFNHNDVKISPRSSNEPTAIGVDWDNWKQIIPQRPKDPVTVMQPGREIEVTDVDIIDMPMEQLDQYMDWFQRTWAEQTVVSEAYQGILEMFPLQKLPKENTKPIQDELQAATQLLKNAQNTLVANRIITEGEIEQLDGQIFRPGQCYQQFRMVEHLSGPALSFHREAAKLACISLETLLRAVLQAERRAVVWQHERRRAEVHGHDED